MYDKVYYYVANIIASAMCNEYQWLASNLGKNAK